MQMEEFALHTKEQGMGQSECNKLIVEENND